MEFKFKKYTNTGSRLGNYSISLSPTLSLGLLSGFYIKEGLKNYRKIILFYDKENSAIGIQFTNDEKAEGALTIIHSEKRTNGAVTIHNFMLENDLNKKEFFGKWTPKRIVNKEFGEMFIVEFKKRHEIT